MANNKKRQWKDEYDGKEYTFTQRVVCPWAKQVIRVEGKYLFITKTNTIFGMIPSGKEERKISRYWIHQSVMNTDVRGMEALISVIIAGSVFSMFQRFGFSIVSVLMGLLFLALGLLLFMDSFTTSLTIGAGHNAITLNVPILERNKLQELYPKLQLGSGKKQENHSKSA